MVATAGTFGVKHPLSGLLGEGGQSLGREHQTGTFDLHRTIGFDARLIADGRQLRDAVLEPWIGMTGDAVRLIAASAWRPPQPQAYATQRFALIGVLHAPRGGEEPRTAWMPTALLRVTTS